MSWARSLHAARASENPPAVIGNWHYQGTRTLLELGRNGMRLVGVHVYRYHWPR